MTARSLVSILVEAATPRGLTRRKTRRALRRKARVADHNGAVIAREVALALRKAARYWGR